jgi:phosphoserine/homoserine phosphotransferase
MQVVCLDLEGVLIPEIWIEFAQKTGINELLATTRDIPDYDQLMHQRLSLLDQHGLRLDDIQAVIGEMSPLPGAREFLDSLRQNYQVIILSDTFYDFAAPFMAQLAWPTLFCHRLEVAGNGKVVNYLLRQPDPKRASVKALKQLNFTVFAAGDSYNDTTMLEEAHAGFLFRAPENVISEFPQYPHTTEYGTLREQFDAAAVSPDARLGGREGSNNK